VGTSEYFKRLRNGLPRPRNGSNWLVLKTRSSFGPVGAAEHGEQAVKRGIFR
jgi:hypothetical protein